MQRIGVKMQQYCLNLMGLTFYQRKAQQLSPLVSDVIRFLKALDIDYSLSNNVITLNQTKILLAKDKQVIFNEIMEVFYRE